MSASIHCTPWNLPTGWPNCWRCFTYSSVASSAALLAPTAYAAAVIRPSVSVCMAVTAPRVSSPRGAGGGRRGGDPAERQRLHGRDRPAVLLAEERLVGDDAAVEGELGRLGRAHAQGLHPASHDEAGEP